MAGPKAFGFLSRMTAIGDAAANNQNLGAVLVRPAGQAKDTSAPIEGGVVGVLRGTSDGVTIATEAANTSFLMTAALGLALRAGTPTVFDRLRAGSDAADDAATNANGVLLALARQTLFDGAAWDRARGASAANLAALSGAGAQLVAPVGNWSVASTPAAATQASATRAAGGAGVRHVCTSIHAAFVLPEPVNQPLIQVVLRDGASGAGSILWGATLGLGVAAITDLTQTISISSLSIVGSVNTAMTLEFSAAGVATTAQSVSMTGYSAN